MTAAEAREKVAKLRARTVARGATPAEAATAQRMADRLVARYGLDREPPRPRQRVYSTAGRPQPRRQRVWSTAMPVARDTPAFDAFFGVAPGEGRVRFETPDGQRHDAWPGGTCRIVVE